MFCPVHHPTLTSFCTDNNAGIVYTEESVVHSFVRGGNLEFNVNIFNHPLAHYIDSLAWYHNGTQIVSGNKYTISNNDTMLMISNMVGSDAGTYEVKVHSISYDSDLNSPLCSASVGVHSKPSSSHLHSTGIMSPHAVVIHPPSSPLLMSVTMPTV